MGGGAVFVRLTARFHIDLWCCVLFHSIVFSLLPSWLLNRMKMSMCWAEHLGLTFSLPCKQDIFSRFGYNSHLSDSGTVESLCRKGPLCPHPQSSNATCNTLGYCSEFGFFSLLLLIYYIFRSRDTFLAGLKKKPFFQCFAILHVYALTTLLSVTTTRNLGSLPPLECTNKVICDSADVNSLAHVYKWTVNL